MSDGVNTLDAARKAGIVDRWERANAMVDALCQPRGTAGAREWLMSIPARPERDPDLIISSALSDVPALLDALAAAEGRAAALEAELVQRTSGTVTLSTAQLATIVREKDRLRAALWCLMGGMNAEPETQRGTQYRRGCHTEAMYQQAVAALGEAAPVTREE